MVRCAHARRLCSAPACGSPLIDERRLRISEVGEAHRFAESGQAVGTIVLAA